MTKAYEITSLSGLRAALIEDDNIAITGMTERLDRHTANECMRRTGESMGFPTVEIEGVVRTSAGYLAKVFGYKQPHAVAQMLERRGIEGIKPAWFTRGVWTRTREALGLSPKDTRVTLYDWPSFLIVGMHGQTPEALKVEAYLLKMERLGRIGIANRQIEASTKTQAEVQLFNHTMREAGRGNSYARWVLEHDYGIPVEEIDTRYGRPMVQNRPVRAEDRSPENIARDLHKIMDMGMEKALEGLTIGMTEGNHPYIEGETSAFVAAFATIDAERKLPKRFLSSYTLGGYIGRITEELEALGWLRSIARVSVGHRFYRFELMEGASL